MRENKLSGAEKGGENVIGEDQGRFIQTLISASDHKDLRRIALEEEISLAILLREIIHSYLENKKENNNGKS